MDHTESDASSSDESSMSGNELSSVRETTPSPMRYKPLSERETTPFSWRETTPESDRETTPSYMSETTPESGRETTPSYMSETTGNSVSLLERMPGEIRNQIYRYLLSVEYATIVKRDTTGYFEERIVETSHLGNQSYKFSTSILRLNKNIAHESQDFFYHRNRFVRISTNSKAVFSCATNHVPVVCQHAAIKFEGHLLNAVVHCNATDIRPDIYQTVLVGKDVPTFIEHLQVAELSWAAGRGHPPHSHLEVRLKLRTGHETGHVVDQERAVLAPWEELVRVGRCQVSGCIDFGYARELAYSMIRWLPVAPDIIEFCEKIRTQSKNAGEADLSLLHDQYLSALNRFRVVLKSRGDVRIVGGPETVMRLHTLIVLYLMELSLVLVKSGDFDGAVGWAENAIVYLAEHIPECPPKDKARLYFQLGLIHMRKAYPDDILTAIEQVGIEERLDPAQDYLSTAHDYLPDIKEFQALFREVALQVYGTLPEVNEPAV